MFSKSTSKILLQVPQTGKLNIYPLFTDRGQIQFSVFFMIFDPHSGPVPEQNKKKCIIPQILEISSERKRSQCY